MADDLHCEETRLHPETLFSEGNNFTRTQTFALVTPNETECNSEEDTPSTDTSTLKPSEIEESIWENFLEALRVDTKARNEVSLGICNAIDTENTLSPETIENDSCSEYPPQEFVNINVPLSKNLGFVESRVNSLGDDTDFICASPERFCFKQWLDKEREMSENVGFSYHLPEKRTDGFLDMEAMDEKSKLDAVCHGIADVPGTLLEKSLLLNEELNSEVISLGPILPEGQNIAVEEFEKCRNPNETQMPELNEAQLNFHKAVTDEQLTRNLTLIPEKKDFESTNYENPSKVVDLAGEILKECFPSAVTVHYVLETEKPKLEEPVGFMGKMYFEKEEKCSESFLVPITKGLEICIDTTEKESTQPIDEVECLEEKQIKNKNYYESLTELPNIGLCAGSKTNLYEEIEDTSNYTQDYKIAMIKNIVSQILNGAAEEFDKSLINKENKFDAINTCCEETLSNFDREINYETIVVDTKEADIPKLLGSVHINMEDYLEPSSSNPENTGNNLSYEVCKKISLENVEKIQELECYSVNISNNFYHLEGLADQECCEVSRKCVHPEDFQKEDYAKHDSEFFIKAHEFKTPSVAVTKTQDLVFGNPDHEDSEVTGETKYLNVYDNTAGIVQIPLQNHCTSVNGKQDKSICMVENIVDDQLETDEHLSNPHIELSGKLVLTDLNECEEELSSEFDYVVDTIESLKSGLNILNNLAHELKLGAQSGNLFPQSKQSPDSDSQVTENLTELNGKYTNETEILNEMCVRVTDYSPKIPDVIPNNSLLEGQDILDPDYITNSEYPQEPSESESDKDADFCPLKRSSRFYLKPFDIMLNIVDAYFSPLTNTYNSDDDTAEVEHHENQTELDCSISTRSISSEEILLRSSLLYPKDFLKPDTDTGHLQNSLSNDGEISSCRVYENDRVNNSKENNSSFSFSRHNMLDNTLPVSNTSIELPCVMKNAYVCTMAKENTEECFDGFQIEHVYNVDEKCESNLRITIEHVPQRSEEAYVLSDTSNNIDYIVTDVGEKDICADGKTILTSNNLHAGLMHTSAKFSDMDGVQIKEIPSSQDHEITYESLDDLSSASHKLVQISVLDSEIISEEQSPVVENNKCSLIGEKAATEHDSKTPYVEMPHTVRGISELAIDSQLLPNSVQDPGTQFKSDDPHKMKLPNSPKEDECMKNAEVIPVNDYGKNDSLSVKTSASIGEKICETKRGGSLGKGTDSEVLVPNEENILSPEASDYREMLPSSDVWNGIPVEEMADGKVSSTFQEDSESETSVDEVDEENTSHSKTSKLKSRRKRMHRGSVGMFKNFRRAVGFVWDSFSNAFRSHVPQGSKHNPEN